MTCYAGTAGGVIYDEGTVSSCENLEAVGNLASEPVVRLAGSILSIDQQHISVLLFALGQYPVPETFATAALAYVP